MKSLCAAASSSAGAPAGARQGPQQGAERGAPQTGSLLGSAQIGGAISGSGSSGTHEVVDLTGLSSDDDDDGGSGDAAADDDNHDKLPSSDDERQGRASADDGVSPADDTPARMEEPTAFEFPSFRDIGFGKGLMSLPGYAAQHSGGDTGK
jgi:hypothetical protein